MNGNDAELRSEIERIRRVADMLATAHAHLRDTFALYAILLDLAIIAISIWLVSLAFVAPRLNVKLTPLGLDPQVWAGLLAVFTLFLAVVQIRVDWKQRSDAHRRALELYAEVKREAGYVLAAGGDCDAERCQRVFARYDLASAVAVAVPESRFLTLKKKHLQKIALSKYLDRHPSASLVVTRLRLWYKDNVSVQPDGDGKT